jgi:hypothetical protein
MGKKSVWTFSLCDEWSFPVWHQYLLVTGSAIEDKVGGIAVIAIPGGIEAKGG